MSFILICFIDFLDFKQLRHYDGSPLDTIQCNIWVLKLNQLRTTALKYHKGFRFKGV